VSFRLLNIPIVSLRSDSNNDIQSLPSYLIILPNYNVLLWRINLHVQRLIYDLVWITSITILIYYMKYITVEWIGGAALGTYDTSRSKQNNKRYPSNAPQMLYVARLCSAHSKRGRPQCNALNKIHFKTPLSAHIRMLLRSLASRSLRSNGEFEPKCLNKKFILAYIKVRSPVLAFTKNF
jgi:hypothetical protein